MPAALNLQEFSPHPLSKDPLECTVTAEEVDKAYTRGYDAGVKAGTEASALVHAEAQDRLRAELVETLRDQHQSRFAAQTEVLQGVVPLIETVVQQIVPHLVRDGLPEHARRALETALEARPDVTPVLRCAPDAMPSLETAFKEWKGRYEVRPDSKLTPHEVHIAWDDGFDQIDLGAMVTAVLSEIRNATALMAETTQQDTAKDAQDVG
ncbi:MAG: hypothetical protein AAF813_06800 [Pseudomonadota bacterium]